MRFLFNSYENSYVDVSERPNQKGALIYTEIRVTTVYVPNYIMYSLRLARDEDPFLGSRVEEVQSAIE